MCLSLSVTLSLVSSLSLFACSVLIECANILTSKLVKPSGKDSETGEFIYKFGDGDDVTIAHLTRTSIAKVQRTSFS